MDTIKSNELVLDQVPLSDAKINKINAFALSFSLSEVNNSSLNVNLNDDLQKLSLVELRYLLYCEQRRWNHFSKDYDNTTEHKIRAIIKTIRSKIYM